MTVSTTPSSFTLSQGRLAHIEKAPTLGEAQRMGLLDTLKDWCRGGVKAQAIKEAFDTLHSPAPGQHAEHGKMLMHFNNIRSAMRPELAHKCQLEVTVNQAADTWSYSMRVDGKPLVVASGLPVQSGYALASFQDHAMLSDLGNYLHDRYGVDTADAVQELHEQFCAINAMVAEGPAQPAENIQLEKFRILGQNLGALGVADKHACLDIDFSNGLSKPELRIDQHVLGAYSITSQSALTATLATVAQVAADAVDIWSRTRDLQADAKDAVQDMVDGKPAQRAMASKREDPLFSRQNLVTTEVGVHGANTFSAWFRDAQTDRDEVLTFSNRPGSNNELRGERLRTQLEQGSYGTLEDLIMQDFGTPRDALVSARMVTTFGAMQKAMSELGSDSAMRAELGLADDQAVADYLQGFKENVLAPITVARTDLGALWKLQDSGHGSLQPVSTAAVSTAAVSTAAVSTGATSTEFQPGMDFVHSHLV